MIGLLSSVMGPLSTLRFNISHSFAIITKLMLALGSKMPEFLMIVAFNLAHFSTWKFTLRNIGNIDWLPKSVVCKHYFCYQLLFLMEKVTQEVSNDGKACLYFQISFLLLSVIVSSRHGLPLRILDLVASNQHSAYSRLSSA